MNTYKDQELLCKNIARHKVAIMQGTSKEVNELADYYINPSAFYHGVEYGLDLVLKLINNSESADVAKVTHGKWINAYPDIEPNPMFMYGICSVCGCKQSISEKLLYCMDCGAKMDK